MGDSNTKHLLPTLANVYGSVGSGLLPTSMTRVWADERLPKWVSELAGLPAEATFAALEGYRLPANAAARDRLCRFAQQLIQSRRSSLQGLPVIHAPPQGLQLYLADIPCSKRTRKALEREGLDQDWSRLSRLTFGELLRLPNIGVRSALDFAVTLQSVLESAAALMKDTISENPFSNALVAESPDEDLLRQLAQEPWASLVSAQDPRFRDLMAQLGSDTIAELVEAVISAWDTLDARKTCIALIRAYPNLRARITRIKAQTLEDQLLELFRGIANLEGPRFDALLARFGWAGEPPVTLAEAGKSIGITRERIRQVEIQIRNRLPSHQVFVPALSRGIVELERNAPLDCDSAASLLVEKSIASMKFAPQSVIAAASDLGEATDLQMARVQGREFVALSDASSVGRISVLARRLCGAMGVCSAAQICEELDTAKKESGQERQSAATNADGSTEDDACEQSVAHALSLTQQVQPLGNLWYWAPSVPQHRNRLVNCSRRMLSVTERISIRRMREGIRRHFKFRNSSGYLSVYLRVPGSEVMRNFFRTHPDFEVDANDLVTSNVVLDYREELGPLERTLVEVLRASPSPMMDRQSIRNACLKRGLNPHSLEMALTYSPVIEHLDLNIWALRGVDANPASLDAMREANALRERGKRLHGFGWTKDGKIWVAARLPEAVLGFVLGAPGPMRRFLSGQKFNALREDGDTYGVIGATDEGMLYGFAGFLRVAGAEGGDILVMEFDLTTSSVTLRLGADELLDAYEQGQGGTEAKA